jgi:hypothetical protein
LFDTNNGLGVGCVCRRVVVFFGGVLLFLFVFVFLSVVKLIALEVCILLIGVFGVWPVGVLAFLGVPVSVVAERVLLFVFGS